MLKEIKCSLFVICVMMFSTFQLSHADDNKKQQQETAPRQQEQPGRETPHNNQSSQQAQSRKEAPHNQGSSQVPSRREAPQQAAHRQSPPVQEHRVEQPVHRENQGPRVYAVPQAVSVENNNLFHRQHHKHWQPRYNFYDDQYHFYPYVNIASTVELSASYMTIGFEGQNYYYDDGTFYVQDDSGQFAAVPPPIGIIVSLLPADARQIIVDGQVYWRYKGVCYVQIAQGYQVVAQVQDPSDSQ